MSTAETIRAIIRDRSCKKAWMLSGIPKSMLYHFNLHPNPVIRNIAVGLTSLDLVPTFLADPDSAVKRTVEERLLNHR